MPEIESHRTYHFEPQDYLMVSVKIVLKFEFFRNFVQF